MGVMKEFDRRIRAGGDDAIAAVSEYVAEQERLVAQVQSMLQRACDRQWREWIPVEDRLPEEFATVLVVISTPSGSHVSFMSRHPQDGFWQHADGDIDEINVTHWMPLPEPPEVKP